MKRNNIGQAPLIRAFLLLNQENAKKNIKEIQKELKKMYELFGDEFNKNIHLLLFNDVDFNNFQNQKKFNAQFFLKDFPFFIENPNFIEIFSEVLMDAKDNNNKMDDIFNTIKKICKLNIRNQIKLILSFIISDVDKYQAEARMLLFEKCKEIYEQKKINELNKSIIEHLLIVLNAYQNDFNDENEKDEQNYSKEIKSNINLYIKYFMDFDEQVKCEESNNSKEPLGEQNNKDNIVDDLEQNNNISINGEDNYIEIEKILYELGPLIINNNINLKEIDIINTDLDLNRLSELLLFMINNETWILDKEHLYINKIFIETINKDYLSIFNNITQGETITWDINAFYNLFQSSINQINKKQLLKSFDNSSFFIQNSQNFNFFVKILEKFNLLNSNQDFFNDFIFIKWKNQINQIKLIDFLINNKEISEFSCFSFKNYSGEKIRKDIELKAYTSSKNHYLIDNWRTVKLVEILINLSEGDYIKDIKKIFEWPIQNIPEILSLSLLSNKNINTKLLLFNDLVMEILPPILNDKNPRLNLINEIWQTNKDIVVYVLYKLWEKEPDLMNLSAIFDIANTLLKDGLLFIVNSKYHSFSVNLGLLASKRDYLHVEQWIKKNIEQYEDTFINALLNYLDENLIQPFATSKDEINKDSLLEKAQLSLESLSIILNTINNTINTNFNNSLDNIINENIINENHNKNNNENNIIMNHNKNLNIKTREKIEEINKKIYEIYDELQDHQINSEEIEEEVSQLLRFMFEEKITVDHLINHLIKYKKSSDKKENELNACLIHGVLDEHRFFHQYPEKKLRIISELFGKIINNKLLEGVIETLALNYILEDIKSGNNMRFLFGVTALSQFIDKISHWPSYMNSLIEVEQLMKDDLLYKKLIKQYDDYTNKKSGKKENDIYIEKDKENINFNKLKNKLSGQPRSFLDIDCSMIIPPKNKNESEIQKPSDEIVNNIKNLLESLNKNNIPEKINEIKTIIKDDEQIIRWFSYFFTTNKINHTKKIDFQLYNEFFVKLDHQLVNKFLLKDTIGSIHELLKIDTLYLDSNYKLILNNLGTWLGFNTILKNRPILVKDIDFKELIANAYENDKLMTIIPFTCRVFIFISKSKVFNINNPWINALLSLLAEIHNKASFNHSIKKEIETFFNTVKIEINSLSQTKYLEKIHIRSNSHDFVKYQKYDININNKELSTKIGSLDNYINNLLNTINADSRINNNISHNKKRIYITNIDSIANNDSENENNYNINNQNGLINILTKIMNQSINETIPELMDLYVDKPIKTAITIVNKDFAFENNVNKYKTSLDNTLNTIMKTFSLIGSHDKLQSKINSELEKILKLRHLDQETINKIKQLPNSEYINIGLDYIKLFIMKEAQNKLNIDKKVKDEINKRKQGILLNDHSLQEYKRKIEGLPNKIKPNESCILDNEYKIYENFNIISKINLYEEENVKSSFLNTVYRILKEVVDKTSNNSNNKINNIKNYDLCMKNIKNINNNIIVSNNYDDGQQLVCLEEIISDSKIDDLELSTQLSLNTFHYAIESIKIKKELLFQVYLYILRGWVKLFHNISKNITIQLFTYNIDIFLKFKKELHFNLFKNKIVNYSDYENFFIETLNNSPVVNNIVKNLVKNLFPPNNTNKVILPKIKTYYYDNNSNNYYMFFNSKTSILININNINLNNKNLIIDQNKNQVLYIDKCVSLFVKILKANSENNYDNLFENDTIKNELLMNENEIIKYIKIICLMCLKGPYESQQNNNNLFYSENASIFIYHILNMIKNENMNKINLFCNIIDIIIDIFHNDYLIYNINFNQRKYYKLFFNLIYLIDQNWSNNDNNFFSSYKKIDYLMIIVDSLKILSPMNYPGFCLAWLDLISCHYLISNFIDSNLIKENSYKYEKYLSLITEALSYFNFFRNNIINHYNLKVIIDNFYKFFYILSNSYPSFIVSYQLILLSYIFPLESQSNDEEENDSENETENERAFIQLKNIFLSATPPEFSTQNNNSNNSGSKSSKEITKMNYKGNFMSLDVLIDNNFSQTIIDLFYDNNDNSLKSIINKCINEPNKENNLDAVFKFFDDIKEDKEMIIAFNSLLSYWCNKKHKHMTENKIKSKKLFYNMYLYLLMNMDEKHKNYLIESILNNLRFPCLQTINCSLLFQELFINVDNEDIEEQLLLNLLERLLYKPIPWGITYTVNYLLNNEQYKKMKKNYINNNDLIANFINEIKTKYANAND